MGTLRKENADVKIMRAIALADGNPALLMSAVRDRIKMDDAGNVLDKDGKPRLSESGEFVDSRMHSGSGSPNDAGGGGGIAHLKTEKEPRRSLMTPPEKAAFMKTHGSDAYLNLPL